MATTMTQTGISRRAELQHGTVQVADVESASNAAVVPVTNNSGAKVECDAGHTSDAWSDGDTDVRDGADGENKRQRNLVRGKDRPKMEFNPRAEDRKKGVISDADSDMSKSPGTRMTAAAASSSRLPSSPSYSSSIPWYRQTHLLRLNLLILSVLQLSSTNGYDGSLLNGLQALPQWQDFMHHPTGAWLGFIIAVQSIGQIVTYPFCSWLVQRHGRKAGLYLGYLWLGIAVAVQTSAQGQPGFIVARFFVGAATAMWFGSVPLLIAEVAFPSHRGVCSSLWNCGWFVGATLAAWVTYGTRDYVGSWAWRLPSLLQLALPLVALPGVVFLPESPRWWVAQGKRDKAREVIVKWHAGAGSADLGAQLVDVELGEIEEALRQESQDLAKGFIGGYAQLVKGRGNRWRSFITVTVGVLAQWNGVGIVQYYLVLVLETVGVKGVTEQTLISGFLQVWNLMCAVTGALLVNQVGRRKLFNFSNVAMTVCFVLITALAATFANDGNAAAGITVIPFLFLYYGAYDVAWNPLIFSYTVEIWPYSLRAKGLSLCNMSTALALLFNIFVNPIALANIGWRYYIVYVVILVIATLICWLFYPETKGYTLEQMTVVFDGDKALAAFERGKGFNPADARTAEMFQ